MYLNRTYSVCCGAPVTVKGFCVHCNQDLRSILRQFNRSLVVLLLSIGFIGCGDGIDSERIETGSCKGIGNDKVFYGVCKFKLREVQRQ